jgi:type VI secretion system protein ImpH
MGMASSIRRTGSSVIDQLFQGPYRFEFFQAVRLLETAERLRAQQSDESGRGPIGYDTAPHREIVRFRAWASLTFPAGPIAELRRIPATAQDEDAPAPEMTVSFMGLTGPSGVLPQHYTSMLIERCHTRNQDNTLRDFFDLFHHRSISLFYRAWEKYRFPFAYERWQSQSGDSPDRDLFTFCLFSFVGLGTAGQCDRLAFDPQTVIYYGGHFAHFPRCAISLEAIIQDYFHVPTEVMQFCGQWLYLAESDQSALPSAAQPDGQNAQLGISTVVGTRVWDVEGKFRLRLGPVRYDEFLEFMPSGNRLLPLSQLARLYAGAQFDFDVQVVLLRDEVPLCQLGNSASAPARLGWNTWIFSDRYHRNAEDAVFRLPHI